METLTANNITLQDQLRLGGGKAVSVTHLTFYVGSHGPFQNDFVAPNNTPALIQAYIAQKVQDVSSIVNRTY
jgi:hypothetical protein